MLFVRNHLFLSHVFVFLVLLILIIFVGCFGKFFDKSKKNNSSSNGGASGATAAKTTTETKSNTVSFACEEDEVVAKYATFTLNKAIGEEITFTVTFASEVVDPTVDTFIGLTDIEIIKEYAEGIEYDIKGKLTSNRVGILKDVLALEVNDLGITSIDVRNAVNLEILQCTDNQIKSLNVSNNTKLIWLMCKNNLIEKLDLSNNTKLEWIKVEQNKLTSLVVGCSIRTIAMELNQLNETAMDALISSMQYNSSGYTAKIYVKHSDASEKNEITDTQIAAIQALNYKVYLHNGSTWEEQ